MSRVLAIPFSARPPKGWCAPLREMFPGVKIVASQPIDSTGVKGPDKLVWHVNNPGLKNAERVAYYANNIMTPLLMAAEAMGEHILYMHETVVVEKPKAESLWSMLGKIPTMQFVSAQPKIFSDGINPPRIQDYPSRFFVIRGSVVARWFEPFLPDGRSTLAVVMQRIQDEGLQPGSSYYWDMQMTVNED